jgi:lipid A 3-O-deacylase
MKRIIAALLIGWGLAGGAAAQDFSAGAFGINEVRGGIFAHSWDEIGPGGSMQDFSHINDVNLEVLFQPLPTADWFPGMIRPNVGATINFGGLESMVYAGLSWKVQVLQTPLFVEGGFGGSLNNGKADGAVAPWRDLGCSALFHEQISLGYDLTSNVDVMFTAEHASSGDLCSPNRGLSDLGFRVGWKF